MDVGALVASLRPRSALEKALLAVTVAGALSDLARLGDGRVREVVLDASRHLDRQHLAERVIDERTDALWDELLTVVDRTDVEPDGQAFYAFGVVVAWYYALSILRRGPADDQLRWCLNRSWEIADWMDEEFEHLDVLPTLESAIRTSVDELASAGHDQQLDLWPAFDGVRTKLGQLVADLRPDGGQPVDGTRS